MHHSLWEPQASAKWISQDVKIMVITENIAKNTMRGIAKASNQNGYTPYKNHTPNRPTNVFKATWSVEHRR